MTKFISIGLALAVLAGAGFWYWRTDPQPRTNSPCSRRMLASVAVNDFLFDKVVLKRETLKETYPDSLSRPLTSNVLN